MKKILSLTVLLSTLPGINFSFSSCEKEPEIITKTVIETDTIIVTTIDTVF